MNSKRKKKPSPKRMSYETYAYIQALIDLEMEKTIDEFRIAMNFIPDKTGLDKAHKIFSDAYCKLSNMGTELHLAGQSMYKDHPNSSMRKFWGLPS